ncbi:hypothetical protein [Rhizobium miluonense]|uniref:Uncharacterized protein n=1 Tax=Rhizobium miluonense TaxID=411945 RepID=A0A1C3WV28_9HYPH|nr:hypothetical protein [Rhizobium miluonense]SCB43818.1 hypothetical protein GA0061102_104139 [Rhizobium miluonense]
MAKQTRPFIVEIKPSRKLKPVDGKTSIWGKVDLRIEEELPVVPPIAEKPATLAEDGRS